MKTSNTTDKKYHNPQSLYFSQTGCVNSLKCDYNCVEDNYMYKYKNKYKFKYKYTHRKFACRAGSGLKHNSWRIKNYQETYNTNTRRPANNLNRQYNSIITIKIVGGG